jgi:hypothetical protein
MLLRSYALGITATAIKQGYGKAPSRVMVRCQRMNDELDGQGQPTDLRDFGLDFGRNARLPAVVRQGNVLQSWNRRGESNSRLLSFLQPKKAQ